MSTTTHKSRVQASKPDPKPAYPYILKLRDGRRVYVDLPAEWVQADAHGEMLLRPPAVRFLDKVQALAQHVDEGVPSRGHIIALREALGLTQRALGEAVGVDKLTVSRWERGEIRPGTTSVKRLRRLQVTATRRGVVLD